jgi:hypothetical protein
MPSPKEKFSVGIYPRDQFKKEWGESILEAHQGRGTIRFPVTIPLPGKRILVFKNVPFLSTEIDTDPDALQ